jgi:hypothetical protein
VRAARNPRLLCNLEAHLERLAGWKLEIERCEFTITSVFDAAEGHVRFRTSTFNLLRGDLFGTSAMIAASLRIFVRIGRRGFGACGSKPLMSQEEDKIMRRSTRRNVAFMAHGAAAMSSPSGDIPFARPPSTGPQHSSAAVHFAENTKETDIPLGEARGWETRSLADFARMVR